METRTFSRWACPKRGKTLFLLAAAALVLLYPAAAAAMPPGHFLELFPDKQNDNHFFITLQADSQENEFDRQRHREAEVDSNGEERHFAEIRQSEVTFSQAGARAGAALQDLFLLYLFAGYGEADIDFSYTDELTPQKNSYSRQISMDSDGFPVLGGGISARFFRKPVFKNSFLEAGLDLQYRLLDFEGDEGAVHYESTLHEVQLSLAASIERVQWNLFHTIPVVFSPYGGTKITRFKGDESYKDPANTDGKGNPDPISHSDDLDPGNHVSFFAGASFPVTQTFYLSMETRFGDDDGYAAQVTARF